MCGDIVEVLNSSTLSHGTKHSVIDNVIWVWSEFDGKYEGCKYWSIEAQSDSEEDKDLIHEHLVPRKIIREKIFSLKNPTKLDISHVLEKYCVGVVITKREDETLNFYKLRSTMPANWDGKDVWARYKVAGIEVVNVLS